MHRRLRPGAGMCLSRGGRGFWRTRPPQCQTTHPPTHPPTQNQNIFLSGKMKFCMESQKWRDPILGTQAFVCPQTPPPIPPPPPPPPQTHLPFGCCAVSAMWKPKISLNVQTKSHPSVWKWSWSTDLSDTVNVLVVCVPVLHLQVATSNPTANTLKYPPQTGHLMENLFPHARTKPATRRTPQPSL